MYEARIKYTQTVCQLCHNLSGLASSFKYFISQRAMLKSFLQPQIHFMFISTLFFYHLMLYRVHLAWAACELTTSVAKSTDWIDSYITTITITTTPAPPVNYNNCLSIMSDIVPDQLKSARVKLLFKKNKLLFFVNYRLVTT